VLKAFAMAKGLLIGFLSMFIVVILFVVFPLLVIGLITFHAVLDLLVDFNISSSRYFFFFGNYNDCGQDLTVFLVIYFVIRIITVSISYIKFPFFSA